MICLITPADSSSYVRFIGDTGALGSMSHSSFCGTRPSIYLKSEVIITGGDGMSPDTAYTIGLPNA